MHTLIVEDNPDFCALVVEALSVNRLSQKTSWVGTGREALKRLEQPDGSLDLLLVDLGLPDISGLDVIRLARSKDAELPILVISVLSDSENVLAAISAGARGYLHKGDNVLSIQIAIQKVLDGEYPISSSLASYLFELVKISCPSLGDVPNRLSGKELELLRWLSRGFTYKESAERMALAPTTIPNMIKRIYNKLEVNSKVMAVKKASEHGWL